MLWRHALSRETPPPGYYAGDQQQALDPCGNNICRHDIPLPTFHRLNVRWETVPIGSKLNSGDRPESGWAWFCYERFWRKLSPRPPGPSGTRPPIAHDFGNCRRISQSHTHHGYAGVGGDTRHGRQNLLARKLAEGFPAALGIDSSRTPRKCVFLIMGKGGS